MKIAYVIDEEPLFSDVMASTLRIIGFDVRQFFDASSAWSHIKSETEEASRALMFIDMALEPGNDEKLFKLENSDNFLTTGLVLSKLIVEKDIVKLSERKNMVLYSAHYTSDFWIKIENFCSDHKTRSWQKRGDVDLEDIIEIAEE